MSAASQEGGDAASSGSGGLLDLKLPGWMYMVGSKWHWKWPKGSSSDVGFSKGS